MTKPVLSVIVPTRNSERYILDALAGVDASALTSEIIVQDAVSSDRTLELLRQHPRVDLRSEPDHGQADALNRALDRVTGDLVLWLNGDDLVSHEFLDEAAALLLEDQALDCVVGDFGVVDANGRVLRSYSCCAPDRDRLFRRGTYVFSGSAVFRTAALRRLRFDQGLQYCMDYDMWIRASAKLQFHHLSRVGAYLRVHPGSKTGSGAMGFAHEALEVRRRYARNRRERVLALVLWAKQALYIRAQPVRWSAAYAKVRRHKRL